MDQGKPVEQYGGVQEHREKRPLAREKCYTAIRELHSFTLVLSWPIKLEFLLILPLLQENIIFPFPYQVLCMDIRMVTSDICMHAHSRTHMHISFPLLSAPFSSLPSCFLWLPLFLPLFLFHLAQFFLAALFYMSRTQLKILMDLKGFSSDVLIVVYVQ